MNKVNEELFNKRFEIQIRGFLKTFVITYDAYGITDFGTAEIEAVNEEDATRKWLDEMHPELNFYLDAWEAKEKLEVKA